MFCAYAISLRFTLQSLQQPLIWKWKLIKARSTSNVRDQHVSWEYPLKRLLFAAVFGLLTAAAFSEDTIGLAKQYVNMPQVQAMITEMTSPTAMGNQIAASLLPCDTTKMADAYFPRKMFIKCRQI